MATNFPGSLDAFTNPTSADTLDNPPHDQQHADVNDAVEALQAKVGVDGSAVTSSLDYKVNDLPSGIVGNSRTATGTPLSVGTTLVDLGPSITFTAQANRYYRALGMIAVFDRSTAGHLVMEIDLDGASVQSAFAYSSGSGYYEHITAFYVFTTTAGSHTIKLRGKTNTGTATVYNGSLERVALVLEDMGPV